MNLEEQVRCLLLEVANLRAENNLLREENALLKLENKTLKEKLSDLENRLKLDSTNSSKPPSSDGLKKKTVIPNLREKSQKPKGGQPGHKGNTLKRSQDVNETIVHTVDCCQHCGFNLKQRG